MKQLFSFLAAGLLATAAWGQTTVTLTVDMTNEEVSADGMHVVETSKAGKRVTRP